MLSTWFKSANCGFDFVIYPNCEFQNTCTMFACNRNPNFTNAYCCKTLDLISFACAKNEGEFLTCNCFLKWQPTRGNTLHQKLFQELTSPIRFVDTNKTKCHQSKSKRLDEQVCFWGINYRFLFLHQLFPLWTFIFESFEVGIGFVSIR